MRGNEGRKGLNFSGVLGAALLIAFLTGCEALPLPFPFITAAQPVQPESGSEASEAATTPQPEPEAETAAKTAALPPEPVIDDDPARILGLSPNQLTEILGLPELTRREPPAEIWQYRGESCAFDVFLYEEAGSVRVTYLEARDGSAQRVAERGCLNQLLRARLTKPLG